MSNKIIAIIGQIASGKTTLLRYLERVGLNKIIQYTTRQPRDGEVDGKDYHFISLSEFLDKESDGYFAETSDYNADFGHVYYGTSKSSLECTDGENKVGILNPKAVMSLKEAGHNVFAVYLDIPQDVLMRRALERGDKPVEIARRIYNDARLFDSLEFGGYVDLKITDPELMPFEIAERIHNYI